MWNRCECGMFSSVVSNSFSIAEAFQSTRELEILYFQFWNAMDFFQKITCGRQSRLGNNSHRLKSLQLYFSSFAIGGCKYLQVSIDCWGKGFLPIKEHTFGILFLLQIMYFEGKFLMWCVILKEMLMLFISEYESRRMSWTLDCQNLRT